MIEVKNLTKNYKDKTVFYNFNCSFEKNKTTAIVGVSGCGKTTLLNIISGLETFDSGEIINMPQKISFVFQDDAIVSSLSPYKNIKCVIGKTVSKDIIKEHLNEVGLGDYINKPINEMSGGMKRRVAIVRAMIFPSEVVIMDEPFKGLDENTRNSTIEYIKKHLNNRTLIFVTHDEDEIPLLNANKITIKVNYGKE